MHTSSDLKKIYDKVKNHTGIPTLKKQSIKIRPNTLLVHGLQLGDEGKGKIVDNKIKYFLNKKKINNVYVIRSQGGNNAGHTVEKDGVRLGLHQLPSGIFYDEVTEILDSGMVLNVRDLLDEIEIVENVIGDVSHRLILSQDAMLCTDLQRAKEVLNAQIYSNSKGGTKRGIGPTSAEFYDKTGNIVKDLLNDDWEEKFGKRYDLMDKLFSAYNESLAETDVPDFKETKLQKKALSKKVGSKKIFISRIKEDRARLLKKAITKDTFYFHKDLISNESAAVIFEMAQAVGLDPWFGTWPDRTTTPTTSFGVLSGTKVWKPEFIENKVGIIKATYMSSVGARTMPTEINNDWAKWVRDVAHEYGTTTGRPRDICYLDLPFLLYNIHVTDVDSVGITHLDISRKEDPIKVCVGYKKGTKSVPYKPNMFEFSEITPEYIDLKPWDIKDVENVSDFENLPNEAKTFVNFISDALNLNIAAITTGPDHDAYINFK